MTNQTVRIPLGTSVDGVVNVDDTVSGINLRKAPYSSGEYFGELIEDGVYEFTGVASGSYKVYAGSTELTKVDWVRIGEEGAVLSTGDQTIAGVKTASGQWVFSAGLKTDTISEKTSGSGVTIDGVLIKDSLNGSGIVSTTGNQDISGLKQFNEYPLVDDAVEAPTSPRHLTTKDYVDGLDSLVVHKTGSETISGPKQFAGNVVINTSTGLLTQSAYAAPSDDKNYAPKKYVDDQVASIRAIPYQEGSNTVRVISDGTTEAGKVYRSIAAASSYFGTTTSTNPVFINLVKHATGGVFYLNGSSTIKNYMTISGQGQKTWVVLSDGNTSLTKDAEFRNLSLFLGANDITSARTYNSLTFRDCIIYAYENTTFNNCKFYNTIIIHAATKSASLAGCIAWNSHFNQYTTSDTLTLGVYTHGFDTGLSYYTLPTDPSLEP